MQLIMVDDTDSGFSYAGDWQSDVGSTRQWGGGTTHISSTDGSTVTYKFSGSSIRVWVTLPAGSGNSMADYSVDGKVVRVSYNDGSQPVYSQLSFSSGSLNPGQHTLVITNRGSDQLRFDSIGYNPESDGSDIAATVGIAIPASPAPGTTAPSAPNSPSTSTTSVVVQHTNTVTQIATQNVSINPANPTQTVTGSGSVSQTTVTANGASASGISITQSQTSDVTITHHDLQTVTAESASGTSTDSSSGSGSSGSFSSDSSKNAPTGAIVGGVLAAIVALIVLLLLILLLRRRRRKDAARNLEGASDTQPMRMASQSSPTGGFWTRSHASNVNVVPYDLPPSTPIGPVAMFSHDASGGQSPRRLYGKSSRDFSDEYSGTSMSDGAAHFPDSQHYAETLPNITVRRPNTHFTSLSHQDSAEDIYASPVRQHYLSGDTIVSGGQRLYLPEPPASPYSGIVGSVAPSYHSTKHLSG